MTSPVIPPVLPDDFWDTAPPPPTITHTDIITYIIDYANKHGQRPHDAEVAQHFGITTERVHQCRTNTPNLDTLPTHHLYVYNCVHQDIYEHIINYCTQPSLASIAQHYHIPLTTVTTWVNQWEREGKLPKRLSPSRTDQALILNYLTAVSTSEHVPSVQDIHDATGIRPCAIKTYLQQLQIEGLYPPGVSLPTSPSSYRYHHNPCHYVNTHHHDSTTQTHQRRKRRKH